MKNSSSEQMGNYRWGVCAMLFLATTINYIDRQIIGLLKPVLEIEFGWTEVGYGYIVMAFAGSYALGYAFFGGFIDKVGTKLGYAVSVSVWSIAAMLHASARSIMGFGIVRGLLGFSEAGNFPAAVKAVAEWFPKKERALATGIFNSGTSIGAVVAPILVPLLLVWYGWQGAFLVTGALGFVWLAVWWWMYEVPARHQKISDSERRYIEENSGNNTREQPKKLNLSWIQLLSLRQTWVFIVGKVMTDPVWWFFLFWLPSYFADTFSLDLTRPSLQLAVVYAATTVGSIGGGYLSSRLVRSGWSPLRARKRALLIAAILVLPILLAQYVEGIWGAVAVISVAVAAHQVWSTNIFTVVSDIVPIGSVSSVVGIGGMAGSVGATLFPLLAGNLLAYFKDLGNITAGYNMLFIICGCAYLLAWLIIQLLTYRMKPLGGMEDG